MAEAVVKLEMTVTDELNKPSKPWWEKNKFQYRAHKAIMKIVMHMLLASLRYFHELNLYL